MFDQYGESSNTGYNKDQERRQHLAQIVQEVLTCLQGLDMKQEYQIADGLEQIVLRDTFKVLVLGEFKTGKSTFINALLGDQVLPSYATPCTAVINEVKWGESKQAILYYQNQEYPPKKIPVEDLEDYVIIKDSEDEIRESPYAKVELFWPLKLCQNNVEIIDSPGLNESEVREKVTLDYLRKVDAILFVFTALRLGPSIYEQEAIDSLRESGHEEIFFIVNRFDMLRPRDQDQVRERGLKKLKELTKRREKGVYFISSLEALEGRLGNNPLRVEQSDIQPLETALEDFLANDRGRVKLMRAALELRLTIGKAQRIIPEKESMLAMPLAQLEERYKEVNKQLHQLELDAESIVRRVTNFRSDLRELARGKTREFYVNIESRIDIWAEEYEPETSILSLNLKQKAKEISQEVATHLRTKLTEEFEIWQQTILTPYIRDRLGSLLRELERQTEEFADKLSQVRIELTDVTPEIDADGVDIGGPQGPLQRTLAAAGGWIIGGPAVAGLGAIFGFDEVLRSILPQVGAVIAAMIIGLPVLPVAIVAALVQGGIKIASLSNKVKQETAKLFKQKIRESSADQADKIAKQINQEFLRLEKQLDEGLHVQITEVREQVEAVLSEKRQGQEVVEAKQLEIKQIEKNLHNIESRLFEFTATLVAK